MSPFHCLRKSELQMSECSPFSLAGEVAVITGGGTGLGFGIASCFVRAGARVILVGRNSETLEQAGSRLGPNASWISHDITEVDRAGQLFEAAEAIYAKAPSIVVNNAGIHLKKPAEETSPGDFAAVMQTHVNASQALIGAILPSMLNKGRGSILFTASMTALFGMPNVIAYSAAKTALVGMTRALAAEVSGRGVRVNAIAPGWIESRMLRQALANDPMREQKILARTPMARFGDPDDIGWAATYLCSPAAKFITGTILPVDGGASIGF